MLTTVRGYYDGNQIVVDELDKAHLRSGNRVIITVLPETGAPRETQEERAERRRRILEEERYVHPTGRSAEERNRSIRELRGDERFNDAALARTVVGKLPDCPKILLQENLEFS